MSNSQPTHVIHFSSDLRHLLLDTNPTRLRCNDSFVHPSRRTHPTQKFVRRHQHDLTSAQARTPADLASHRSQEIPEQQLGRKTLLHSELLAQIVQSSLTCQVVLHLLPLVLFSQRGSLSFCPRRAGFFPDVTARGVRLLNRHLLISSVFRYSWHIPLHLAQLELFSSLSLALSRRSKTIYVIKNTGKLLLDLFIQKTLGPQKYFQWLKIFYS